MPRIVEPKAATTVRGLMQQPDMSLPALEQLEEATKQMAAMCSGFYLQLIKDHVPDETATAMSCEFTHALATKMFAQDAA